MAYIKHVHCPQSFIITSLSWEEMLLASCCSISTEVPDLHQQLMRLKLTYNREMMSWSVEVSANGTQSTRWANTTKQRWPDFELEFMWSQRHAVMIQTRWISNVFVLKADLANLFLKVIIRLRRRESTWMSTKHRSTVELGRKATWNPHKHFRKALKSDQNLFSRH